MRSTVGFDPLADYGASSLALREIAAVWTAIDWFRPVPEHEAMSRAVRWFAQHHRVARLHAPDAFPELVKVRTVRGGWRDFQSLSERVRVPSSWDWKFSALKPLCFDHSEARGWRISDEDPARDNAWCAQGSLFQRLGEIVFWNFHPKLDVAGAVEASTRMLGQAAPTYVDVARWYFSYACVDLTHCVEWQLAERTSNLDGNPFLPLMRCHTEGIWPFGVARDEMILFAFGSEASTH